MNVQVIFQDLLWWLSGNSSFMVSQRLVPGWELTPGAPIRLTASRAISQRCSSLLLLSKSTSVLVVCDVNGSPVRPQALSRLVSTSANFSEMHGRHIDHYRLSNAIYSCRDDVSSGAGRQITPPTCLQVRDNPMFLSSAAAAVCLLQQTLFTDSLQSRL